MKVGKLEKQILEVLELPYPIKDDLIESYPLVGSDVRNLIKVIYGKQGDFFSKIHSEQASIARALSRLDKKRLIAKLRPVQNENDHQYDADERIANPYSKYTVLPRDTKFWYVLPKHLHMNQELDCLR